MEIVHNNALLVRTRNPDKITQVIQKSKVIKDEEGVAEVLVQWNLGHAMILKNLGFNKVLSPILGHYAWPGMYKPFAHQKDTAAFLTIHKRAFCLNAMGTGKSAAAAWAADYLLEQKAIRRVLIICPLSIMDCAWRSDLFKTVMHRRVGIAHGSREQRVQVINSNADFVIINYDGVEVVRDELARGGFDLIIADESSYLKNTKTRRHRAFNSLIGPDTWVWLMTGTPAAQSPEDAYGQAKIVNPSAVPSYAGAFKDKVMIKITQFKWIPRPEAQEIVHSVLQPAIRYTTEECLDLPEQLYTTYEVPMTAQQEKYYSKLRKEMLIQAAGEEVSAVNAAVQLGKLLQISCIAYNTPVLTDYGWVPIQEVTPLHRVWDGVDWVKQDGTAFRGDKKVEECWGVQMTLDHRVLTTTGWQTAEDILYGKSSVAFNRAAVRLPNRYSKGGYIQGKEEESPMVMFLRLWKSGGAREPIPTNKTQNDIKELWVPSWKRNAQDVEHQSIQQLPQYAEALLKPLRQGLQKLWGEGHRSLCTMARVIREFLGGHGTNAPVWVNIGSYRQQWPLFPRELPMDFGERAEPEHQSKCFDRHAGRQDDHSRSGRETRHANTNVVRQTAQVQMAIGQSTQRTFTQKTYDLINCGPRNRFVVLGKEGPLIVHNCGAVYSDTGEVVQFDASNKLNEMLNIVQGASHKTLIFCAFRHSIDTVQEFLQKHGISSSAIHGGVSAKKRTEIFRNFQESKEPEVLVIQPQAAAHGVTLTAANTVIWFSPTTSAETYLQANARVHRAGQRNPCLVVHLCSSGVEKQLYKALEDRTLAQSSLLSMYKNFLGGDI